MSESTPNDQNGSGKRPPCTAVERRVKATRRRGEVAKLWLRGWEARDIAQALKCSRITVERDMERIAAQWTMRYIDEVHQIKAKAQARCELLIREGLMAWSRSKEDRVKLRKGIAANGNPTESEERTGQAGDARFLDIVLRAQTQQLNLAGIRPVFEDEAQQVEDYFQLDVKRLPKEQLAALGQALMDCHDVLHPKSVEYLELETKFDDPEMNGKSPDGPPHNGKPSDTEEP